MMSVVRPSTITFAASSSVTLRAHARRSFLPTA